jgi:hypothetical protein
MNHAVVRHQMAEVVRAARNTRRDPARAPDLWGRAVELCELLERESESESKIEGDASAQRCTICVALREDIRTGARSTEDLVDEIVWFVHAMEHDIADAEREAVVDGVVCGDQIDG